MRTGHCDPSEDSGRSGIPGSLSEHSVCIGPFQAVNAEKVRSRPDLELVSIFRVWLYHWRAITIMMMSTIIVTLIITLCMERQYTAVSLVKLINVKDFILKAGKNISNDQSLNPIIANSIVYMTSSDFMRTIVDRKKLHLDPEFSESIDEATSAVKTGVVEKLADRLIASQRGGSRVVAVEMTSHSPEKAADIANFAARLFVRREKERAEEIRKEAVAWLEDKIQGISLHLLALDAQAIEIASQHGIEYTDHEGVIGSRANIQHLELSRQLALAKAEGGELAARYQQALSLEGDRTSSRRVLRGGNPALQALDNLQVTLDTRLLELKGDLGNRHPEIISLQHEIAANQKRIMEEEAKVRYRVHNNLIMNHARQEEIQSRILEVEESLHKKSEHVSNLQRVVDDIQSQKSRLSYLKDIQTNIHFEAGASQEFAEILSPASIPNIHDYPNIYSSTKYSIISGLLLALFCVFFYERWIADFGFKNLEDLRNAGLQPLGIIPELCRSDAGDVRLEDYVLTHPNSAQAEAFQRIRSQLCNRWPYRSNGGAVVLITSTSPSEGKTATAVTLARQMATQNFKVMLIDTSIRNPGVAEVLDLEEKPGLGEILCSNNVENVRTYEDRLTKMNVILAGECDAGIGNMLQSCQMKSLIDELRRHYDWIFLDSAGCGGVSDGFILARSADTVVYAVRWLKARRGEVRINLDELLGVSRGSIGVVLTRVDMDASSKYQGLEEIRHYGYYNHLPSRAAPR